MSTPSKLWVAEIFPSTKEGELPFYMFHCPAVDDQLRLPNKGKAYLYSGRSFVRTDKPSTAILIQQLLNDGALTVKPFNPETK